MSGSLAEVICQAAFDRHVLIDRTNCEALAAAARAFIAGEIAADIEALIAHHKKLRGYVPPTIQVALGAEHHAESIARGDTK
jgi:hypothetical protein